MRSCLQWGSPVCGATLCDTSSDLCLLLGGGCCEQLCCRLVWTVCSKTWIASECICGGSLVIVLNGLNLLTRRNHWIQLELQIKTGPNPKRAAIRFLNVRKPCANTMLNSLLASFYSLDGFSARVISLVSVSRRWFLCLSGNAVWLGDVPNSSFDPFSLGQYCERIWENHWGFLTF